jgi:hypothetical protein
MQLRVHQLFFEASNSFVKRGNFSYAICHILLTSIFSPMKCYPFYAFASVVLSVIHLSAQPTSNPVETRYSGEYAWSSAIQWSTVVNILDHGGVADGITPNDGAFVSAREALVGLGGGVLYFPAGEYYFTDSIGLKDNVVLRGDIPAISDATNPDYRPPSKLVFPKFNFVASGSGTDPGTAFKGIGMVSGESGINTGLVDLDINRGSVFAGGYGTSSENVIIMGVRSNNVASKQPWTVPTAEQEDWQIHPNRFAANVSAFAYRNVLVANCMVNDAHYWLHREDDGKDLTGAPVDLGTLEIDDFEEPGYLVNDGGVWKTLETISGSPYVFEYTDHYGINVQGSTGEWGAPPWVQPNLFYSGAVIRDNWIYTTMRVKIDSSGRGLVIQDNIMKDRQGKTRWYDPNGEKRVSNSATLENRGIDWRGHEVRIEGNEVEVYRHLLNGGPYSSVDGEGILHQEVHGTTIDDLIIRNNTANAYIGIWKMPYTRNVLIEDNTLIGAGYLYVWSDKNGADFPMYNVVIRNNNMGSKGITLSASYYSPGTISANIYGNILDGTMEVEDHVLYSGNTKLDGVTPATVSLRTGAVAIDIPAEGILFADADPDEATAGDTINFAVLVTTPSVTVERVKFYRHKTLMHTDDTPPYTYEYVSDGSRALWSAEIEQPQQAGGLDLYTALLVKDDPAYASPPVVTMTGPAAAGSYVAPVDLMLTADVTAGGSAIDRVEFYSDGSYLGFDADGVAPYELDWPDVAKGSYSLTAKVWDASGSVVVTEPIQIDVEGVPDGVPGSVTAIGYSDTEIDLSWVNTATSADGFDIERSLAGADVWTFVDSVGIGATTYRDGGLTPGAAYDYRIIATNVHGASDPSDIATAATYSTATGLPTPPSGFSASALNADRILLQWIESSGEPFGYRLESRASQLEAWNPLGEVARGNLSFKDSGLLSGTQTLYRIQAWNNMGVSTWVETSGATLPVAFAQSFSSDGDPWPIPGRIEFEDYNVTGGYYDTSSANEGSSDYRYPDSVDMGTGGTGVTIGWITNGEWLQFSVIVEQAGVYSIDVNYASPNTGGSLSLKLDGVNIAPAMVFANTGAWGTFVDHTLSDIYLPAGHYLLRAFVENSGFNLDYVEFTLTAPASYSNWQQALLSESSLPGPLDNADGDAHLNIFDMLFGLNPLVPDSIVFEPDIDTGRGVLLFPIAKGLESVSWNLEYSHDLGQSGPWDSVSSEQIQIVAEETDRLWLQADVPMGIEEAVFFRFDVTP